jgi:RHS repeat-associated protein
MANTSHALPKIPLDRLRRHPVACRRRDGGTAEAQAYDATQQLTQTVTNGSAVTMAYDNNGNRTSPNGDYTSNNLNQYTLFAGIGACYDGNGNLKSYDGWTYEYDAQNRLKTVKHGLVTIEQFWYDGLNRIVTKNLTGNVTYHVYDAWNLIYQDSLGNTSHVTDAVGNLLERYTYSAFGTPTILSANNTQLPTSAYGIRHLFQGQLWTQETGLNDYRNRVELPVMGVFLQPDPIGFKGDAANIYRFCNNNAVNRIDPTGLLDTSASIWNRLVYMEGGSDLTFGQFDLLRQGQACLAPPTGNYKDSNVENHVARKGETGGDPGKTRYTISDVEETSDKLIIRPTLDWYVQDKYKHTSVVKSELEHVNRWLWWQSNAGDGTAMVRAFNRNPTGINDLKAKAENARLSEKIWQRDNIHRNGRYDLSRTPEKAMEPAAIRKLIENVGPVEEPYLGN